MSDDDNAHPPEVALDVAEIARQRDEAERLLLEIAAHRDPCCVVEEHGGCPVEHARRYLAGRGLLTEGT